eukprot:IDg22010t1
MAAHLNADGHDVDADWYDVEIDLQIFDWAQCGPMRHLGECSTVLCCKFKAASLSAPCLSRWISQEPGYVSVYPWTLYDKGCAAFSTRRA